MGILLLIVLAVFLIFIIRRKQYKNTEYYHQTKHSYWSVQLDKGRLGEFYIYKYLKPLKGHKRYLFNLYLPKEDGETTEIDVILLHESGIYVFESKNYSGWIYGTESEQYWTQTLSNGQGKPQKNQFFNPIMQNKGHLKWLQAFLADQTLPFYSYIVFSDRCTLKSITLTSGKHCVVNRYDLLSAIQQNIVKVGVQLSQDTIDDLYEKLYPLTQADENVKLIHIKNIEQKRQEDISQVATQSEPTQSVRKTVCPRCGGTLIIRTAAKGSYQGKKFFGCSNYPNCKYTENLPEQ